LQATIRELAQEAMGSKKRATDQAKGAEDSLRSDSNAKKPGASRPQVDIDLKFFQMKLIPKLHKMLMTSVRQESSAPLFNLIFALRIGIHQERISLKENQFFFKWMLQLNDFHEWRKTEVDFVDMDSEIEKRRFVDLKRELSALYKEDGKDFMERVEHDLDVKTVVQKVGGDEKQVFKGFVYKKASMFIYKLFKEHRYSSLDIMQKICLGFICPDHEFKARLTKFVYETLSEVFDFTEEYNRLHQMLSLAAWRQPIALMSDGHINMINTISSIAQHYGVGLDVIRMD
jgi:hypothetical protein